jgi:hypothetical protein
MDLTVVYVNKMFLIKITRHALTASAYQRIWSFKLKIMKKTAWDRSAPIFVRT